MKALKIIGVGVVSLVLVFFVVGLFLPSDYRVQRSTLIDAPIGVVFDHINDYEKQALWSPWKANDPTMVWTYGDRRVGEGATYSWTSESSGTGAQAITKSIPNQRVEFTIDLNEGGHADGFYSLRDSGNGIETTWGFAGDYGMNIPGRYAILFIDGMVGPYFEQGLAELKQIAEAAQPIAAAEPMPAAATPTP